MILQPHVMGIKSMKKRKGTELGVERARRRQRNAKITTERNDNGNIFTIRSATT